MTTREGNSTKVKSLAKRVNATGQQYNRRPEVQMQLERVISFENEQIYSLLNNKNKHSEDFLLDETIVYLLREAQSEQDNTAVETLYLELNRRIWKLLKSFYSKFNNAADFEDFGQKIELAVIEKIFDTKTDSADYAQVNFGDFLVTQAHVVWRASLNKIKKEQEIFFTSRNEETDEDNLELKFESNELSVEDKLVLQEGIKKLPPHIRSAAILMLDGWQIESKNESELTISKVMSVSSRTIRNWLKEAREILAGYEGEIR